MKNLPECPIETALLVIGEKWRFLILRELLTGGTKRFGELKKTINGISDKMLSQHLKIMEKDGIIHRKLYPEVPPKVEYSLTELGRSLEPVMLHLFQWGKVYQDWYNNEKY